MRLADIFIWARGHCLSDHGYMPDPGRVERTAYGHIVFYHYTRRDRVEQILSSGGGLMAIRPVDVCPTPPQEFAGCFLTEGFLEPLPLWLTNCPYFGNLGIEMVKTYIGDVLLRIELPGNYKGLFVTDYAHMMEVKHFTRRGGLPLNLGYDCSTGREVTQAYVNSYLQANQYNKNHIAPIMQATRKGQGIVIPAEHITVAVEQPLA